MKKLLMMAGIGALIYYLYNKKSKDGKKDKPGMVSDLVNTIKERVAKPLDETGREIPQSTGNNIH